MPRPSRCLDAANAPQSIHWAEIRGDAALVANELVDAVKGSVAPERVVQAVQDLRALLERVERCAAIDPDDVIPVARHGSLWELRLNDHANGVHVRIYCAEIPELPQTIVALHAHAKFTDGTPAEVKERQDQAISEAMLRFMAGKASLWGYSEGHAAT